MYDQKDAHLSGGAATQGRIRPPEPHCAGDDLKDMLSELTRQFLAADERNAAALHDVRGRLHSLGRDAESVRDRVPEQYASAFARIEDGVQMLAERIAAAGRERDVAKPGSDLAGSTEPQPAAVAPAPLPLFQAAEQQRQAPPPVAAVPAESLPGDAAEPWDQASASALASLYDSGEGHVTSQRLDEPAAAPVVAPVMSLAAPAETPSLISSINAHDRAWLEGRFADVASRIEQQLSAIEPHGALQALDGRLEQFEQRFGAALQDVATRADVEGLRIVEAHLNELFTQFERAQVQLDRLEGIEQQIGELGHQLSDERFATLFAQLAPSGPQGPTEEDIEVVAMAVADRVASRMPQPHAVAGLDHDSISELKRVVEGFVAGQRETEEHTSTMLDTMQQAMIRMLDRMDALENTTPSYGAAPAAFAAAPVAPAPVPEAPVAATARLEPRFGEAAPGEPAATLPNRAPQQSKEDFRAAAIADARRAARKVAEQRSGVQATAEVAAVAAEQPAAARRGVPRVEMTVAEPEVEADKPRSRTPLMVAGVALLVAVGFLATSVGINRLPMFGSERQAAQPAKATPVAVDNGAGETTSGTLEGTQTPRLGGTAEPRPSTAAAPNAAPASPRAPGAVEGLSAPLENAQGTVRQDAAIQTPSTVAAANALGIAVTPTSANNVPANSDLARMRRERNMASLASQLAAVQANAPTVPSSLLPHGVETASAIVTESIGNDETAGPAKMPPAQIGPISLRNAAKSGDPSAEFEVAARFAEGRGVSQDFKQAQTWYQRSAQRGFAPAQYRLGTLYERGIGTKADIARAKIWYGRAAQQGHVKAMHNLAVLNAGRDQHADYAVALQWFTTAAEHGLADSQYNLGVLYESGLGMQRDLKQAYHWLSLAANNGDKEAARRRDSVRMKLEEAEVTAADAAVDAWRAKPANQLVNEARAAGEAWKSRASN